MPGLPPQHQSEAPTPPNADDLLALRAQSDPIAFDLIFDHFFHQVYWYCFGILRDGDAAEDAAIMVMERVFAALPGYRINSGSFRSWLFRIAHNLAVDQFRSQRRCSTAGLDHALNVPDRGPTPEESYLAKERQRLVIDLLPLLPEGDRQVVELRLAGLDGGEICAVLGKSRSAVDSAQNRAVTRLRTLVGQVPAGKEILHAEP